MWQANEEQKQNWVFTVAVSGVKKFSFKLCLKVLNSSAEWQLCSNEFQTEGALTLKALTDKESAILTTDSNSLSAYRSVRSGW